MNKDRRILKSVKVEILKLNKPTKTGRIYTTDCIKKALKNPVLKEKLENGVLFGFIASDDIHDISNCSHVVSSLEIENDKLIAAIDILETPKGRILAEALNAGNVRFSAYGRGDVENNMVTNYELESVIAIVKGDNNE